MMIPYRLIGYAVAALLLVGLLIWGPTACQAYMAQKTINRVEGGQAKATLDSVDMADLTETERRALAEAIAEENEALAETILAAEPGKSNDAAMSAVCQTRTYRDDPACVELRSAE